jgi:type IV pilus assembly protein PilW
MRDAMNAITIHRSRQPRGGMRGMSLVELMIAITLGLMILGGVVGIFSATSSARNEVERTSRQIENGRYAMEVLTDDLRLAGFNGELNFDLVAPPVSLPDPCSTTATDWSTAVPLHVQGYDNGSNPPACIGSSLKSGTDIIAVRRVRGCTAGTSGCPAATSGTPYIQVSQCTTDPTTTPFVLGLYGTTTYSLRKKDCTTAASLREYLARTYFISTDNGAGQPIPTLKRREMTGSTTSEVPLVEGIEYMQFVYGIDYKDQLGTSYALAVADTGRDGIVDAYTADPSTFVPGDCPAATCTPAHNWRNVMTVQIYLLARNIETSPGYTDTKTYNLGTDTTGAAVSVGPFNDGYRRHVYSSVVRVVNPAARRDTP